MFCKQEKDDFQEEISHIKLFSYNAFKLSLLVYRLYIWAVTCGFQQCGILTSIDSDKLVQPHIKLETLIDVQSVVLQS